MNQADRASWIRMALAALGVVAGVTGCSLQEAVVDGAYGGVSDTVATIVSESLLTLIGRQ